MLEARAAVRSLGAYRPPVAGRKGLRLDFNENTVGCSPRVIARLRELDAELLARYPERETVEPKVAEFLGLTPHQVLLTNGVDEAIHLLCETYLEPDDEVVIVVPSFSMYEIYAKATGALVLVAEAGKNFCFPTDRVLASITSWTRLIVIANPNNPTGALASREDLLRIIAAAPQAAILVDEAYYEFCRQTLIDQVGALPNLFVTRTFSKAYGLAGLRIGVLVGDSNQIALVRKVTSPYNVNSVALACLPDALEDQEYVSGYAAQVVRSRALLQKTLAEMGIEYWPSQANFVLTRIGQAHQAFVDSMRSRGVLVRDRHSDPGCAGCVRITVGAEAHTEQLLQALRATACEVGITREVSP